MRSVRGRALWLATGAIAILAAAQWLRTPSVPYVVASIVATALTLVAALRFDGRKKWAAVFIIAMGAFSIASAIAQRSIARVDNAWDAYRADIEFGAADQLERALLSTSASLSQAARRALDAPAEERAAFEKLGGLVDSWSGERGVVLYRAGRPVAWAGTTRVSTDDLTAPLGASFTPFYLTLYATATRGDARAVATALVHADPPTDRLARPLDAAVARRSGVRGYEYERASAAPGGYTMFASRTDTLFGARPAAITASEARLRAVELATRRGAVLLGVAVSAWASPLRTLR